MCLPPTLQAVATAPLNAIASFLKNQLLNFEGFGVCFVSVGDVHYCFFIHVATRASLKEYLPIWPPIVHSIRSESRTK